MGKKGKRVSKPKFIWKKTLDDGTDITYTCFYKGYPLGSVWTSNSSWNDNCSPWFSGIQGEDERLPDYSHDLADAKSQVESYLTDLEVVPGIQAFESGPSPSQELVDSGLIGTYSSFTSVDPFTGKVFMVD